MSRPIKFRVWDKDMKTLRTVIDLTWRKRAGFTVGVQDGSQVRVELFPGEYELMQFTGLHDKNGREIYEGDIIQMDKTTGPWFRRSIRFERGCFGYDDRVSAFHPLSDIDAKWSVIGNVNENPELPK